MVKKNIDVVFKFSKGLCSKNKKVKLNQRLAAEHSPRPQVGHGHHGGEERRGRRNKCGKVREMSVLWMVKGSDPR